MKTAKDPRHLHRIELMQSLYTYGVAGTVDDKILEIIGQIDRIDALIIRIAPKHPLAQMNKVDLALLRLGVFELLQNEKPAIIIDELVEIAKEYGADESSNFVHATVDKIAQLL